MGMALKADVVAACQRDGTSKPVDLAHLSAVTMGDRALEWEVLCMFCEQIPHYFQMIENCASDDDIRRAAHTIRGAAKNIGAFTLADMANVWEQNSEIEAEPMRAEFDRIRAYVTELK